MTNSLRFFVYGSPAPQPRARRGVDRAGRPMFYTPSTVNGWKRAIATFAGAHVPDAPWSGPVGIDLTVWLPRQEQMAGPGWPAGPIFADNDGCGDGDNFMKPVMDVLTRLRLWGDDVQVVHEACTKFYVAIGQDPGADVRLETMEGLYPSARRLLEELGGSRRRRRRSKHSLGQLEIIPPRDPLPAASDQFQPVFGHRPVPHPGAH